MLDEPDLHSHLETVTQGLSRRADRLSVDPGERVNLCATEPHRCVPYRQRLDDGAAQQAAHARLLALPPAETAPIDAETLEDLRALGYID